MKWAKDCKTTAADLLAGKYTTCPENCAMQVGMCSLENRKDYYKKKKKNKKYQANKINYTLDDKSIHK